MGSSLKRVSDKSAFFNSVVNLKENVYLSEADFTEDYFDFVMMIWIKYDELKSLFKILLWTVWLLYTGYSNNVQFGYVLVVAIGGISKYLSSISN